MRFESGFLKKTLAEARSRVRVGMRIRRDAGAIDLASIMVGVIVVGILAGIISASIFGVIPWAQDNAAKAQLDAVNTAQSVAQVKDGGFLDSEGLKNAMLLVGAPDSVDVHAPNDGKCFIASSKSATGAVFWISDQSPSPSKVKPEGCMAITNPGDSGGDQPSGETLAAPQIETCNPGSLLSKRVTVEWSIPAEADYSESAVSTASARDENGLHANGDLIAGSTSGPDASGNFTTIYSLGVLGDLLALDGPFYLALYAATDDAASSLSVIKVTPALMGLSASCEIL